jgi:hypothetical protein
MNSCRDMNLKCEYEDDFMDGLRCIKCTRPRFPFVENMSNNIYKEKWEPLD